MASEFNVVEEIAKIELPGRNDNYIIINVVEITGRYARTVVDVRQHFENEDGELIATKQGFSMTLDIAEQVHEAISQGMEAVEELEQETHTKKAAAKKRVPASKKSAPVRSSSAPKKRVMRRGR